VEHYPVKFLKLHKFLKSLEPLKTFQPLNSCSLSDKQEEGETVETVSLILKISNSQNVFNSMFSIFQYGPKKAFGRAVTFCSLRKLIAQILIGYF